MAANRAPADRDADRAAIAEAYLRGVPQYQIALDRGLTETTVSRDLAWLHAQWAARYADALDAHKAAELAKIDALERTYWQEWEASRTEHKRTTQHAEAGTQGQPTPKRATVTTERRDGNPAYLAGVQWCIERRCKLLGLDAPARAEVTGKDGAPLYKVYIGFDPTEV